jgi:hypothetical protein
MIRSVDGVLGGEYMAFALLEVLKEVKDCRKFNGKEYL